MDRGGFTSKLGKLERFKLVKIVSELAATGVGLERTTGRIETSTVAGSLEFHVFAALEELVRCFIVERPMAGLTAAGGPGGKGAPQSCPREKSALIKRWLEVRTALPKSASHLAWVRVRSNNTPGPYKERSLPLASLFIFILN